MTGGDSRPDEEAIVRAAGITRQIAKFVILGLAPRICVATYHSGNRMNFNGCALRDARLKPEHDEAEAPPCVPGTISKRLWRRATLTTGCVESCDFQYDRSTIELADGADRRLVFPVDAWTGWAHGPCRTKDDNMTDILVMYKTMSVELAPTFCNPLAAGVLIGHMVAHYGDKDGRAGAEVFYLDYSSGGRGLTSQYTIDVSNAAIVIFAKNKRNLQVGLTNANTKVTSSTGSICVVKHNYVGVLSQLQTFALLPFQTLIQKAITNFKIWKEAGDGGKIASYATLKQVGASILRLNSLKSGYYIMICKPGAISGNRDLTNGRSYTIPQKTTTTSAISSLIST